MGAKAWMTTSADVVPFLKASFPTSSPTVLDVAGENLPWRATMSTLLASVPPWGRGWAFQFRDCSLLFGVAQQDVVFLGPC